MNEMDFKMGIHTDLDNVILELMEFSQDKRVLTPLTNKVDVAIMALRYIQNQISEKCIMDNNNILRQERGERESSITE
ncbi:MAG: hypothetical protein KGD70_16785 [Candidatus Lokiarchaeota archaeon]|nr:hypothetical protein [Candidatus Lokiarchaeota archaeon]